MIWIAIILVVIVLLLAVCGVLFKSAFCRGKLLDLSDPKVTKGTAWEKYTEDIAEGAAWTRRQNKERVEIKSYDGLKLVGYYLPAEKESNRYILLVHGYKSYYLNDFACASEHYHNMGLNILMVVQRAHSESEGRLICFGAKERFDCRDWVNYIVDRFGENSEIYIDGISMGSTTVQLAAGLALPKNVKGIIADSGFTSPADIVKVVMKRDYHIPKFPIFYIINLFFKICSGFWLGECSTVNAMKNNKISVLFVHGKADDFVPYYMTVESFDACTASKQLLLVDGAGHGTSYMVQREKCEELLEELINGEAK